MKKIIKSTLIMLALSSIIFVSCDDSKSNGEGPPVVPVTPASKIAIVLNGGSHIEISIDQRIDSLVVQGVASITGGDTIRKIEIRRSQITLPGDYKVVKKDTSLKALVYNIRFSDVSSPSNLPSLAEIEKVTYLVILTDNKGVSTRDSVTFAVKPLLNSGATKGNPNGNTARVIGSSANTLNFNRFWGYANTFNLYAIGNHDSTEKSPVEKAPYNLARKNVDKIDFIFWSNMQSANGAGIYSPDFSFPTTGGVYKDLNSEFVAWGSAARRKTKFIRLGANFGATEFNPPSDPSNSAVTSLIRYLKFDGSDKQKNDTTTTYQVTSSITSLAEEVIAFKTFDGKTGLMYVSKVPITDKDDTYQVQIKMAP